MKIKEEKDKNLINQDQLMNEKKDKKTEQMAKSLYQSKIFSKDVINNFLNIFNKYETLINLSDEEVYEDYLIKTTFKIIKNNIKNLLSKNQV